MKKLLLAGALSLFATQAFAQIDCRTRVEIVERMEEKYEESIFLRGLTQGGMVFEFMVNPVSGTWTVVQTAPSGLSCIVQYGDNFEVFDQPSDDK